MLEMRQEGLCLWKLGNNVLPTVESEAAWRAQASHCWLFLTGAPSGGELAVASLDAALGRDLPGAVSAPVELLLSSLHFEPLFMPCGI